MDQLVLHLILARFLICIYCYFGLLVGIGSCLILLVYGNGLFKVVGFGEVLFIGICILTLLVT